MFEAPRLKLRRARYHIGDLQQQVTGFLRRVPFYLEIAAADAPGMKKWVVHVREEVPADFSAIIGDVIHNLRTALDLMACELVRLNGGDERNVYFPFAESEIALDEMVIRRRMDRASPEALALIKSVKPYHGGNEALRAVHDLDIIDKHQTLITAVTMTGTPHIPWEQAMRVGPIRDGASFLIVHQHQMLWPIGYRANGDFLLEFPRFRAVGDRLEPYPLGGKEVSQALIGLAKVIDTIIEEFAALYR